ncbi:hypothetical protein CPB83DRAFT_876358 [Crepidotus variabilis]|uniref:Metallo-beta-lactamase domain-containing protein n=1 Tax=Crepidotus variabilis TaxID=179855 RepID=A0A9P6EDP3_9AGAR|nr:hypothetical protein CPB83DRAFT_876358 [Crepidotus variabilis]
MSLPAATSDQAFWNVSALEAGFLEVPDAMFVAGAPPSKKTLAPTLSFLFPTFPHNAKILSGDVVDSLRKGGIKAEEIDFVCLSHIHLDHIGDTTPFNRCQFVVSSDCRLHLEQGCPNNPSALVPSDLLPFNRTIFLDPAEWKPVGPFTRGLDFFEDGDGSWDYLAADSAHYRVLLSMEPKIATWHQQLDGKQSARQ